MLFAVFYQPELFLRDADKNISIPHLNRICWDIHHGRHLHGLTCPHIKLPAMPRTDNVMIFDQSIAKRTIVMRTDITDREELSRDIKNYDGIITQINK